MPRQDATPLPTEPPTRAPGWRVLGVVAILTVTIVVAATAWHVWALSGYRQSFDRSRSLDQRTSAAQLASRLEPWNAQFATRAVVMAKWQHGALLSSQQAYLPAMLELGAAYKLDIGDTELLALFQRAQDGLTKSSNFKAHIQHGHEGPGGTLRPQDLLP